MDGSANPDAGRNAAGPAEERGAIDGMEAAEGSPYLRFDGFAGPLDHLLILARAAKIDLARISLAALIDQLAAALRQASGQMSLGQKADWVVMAAWLLQLRSRLLLPADAPAQQQATAEASQLRAHLAALQQMQALARWLERQPQLGCDVFGRGQPEVVEVSVDADQAIDVIEFLWASLALFDDDPVGAETTMLYHPVQPDLYAVAEARDRILHRLAEAAGAVALDQLLPDLCEPTHNQVQSVARRCSAWSSTLVAGLELAKRGDVLLDQKSFCTPILARSVGVKDPQRPELPT